MARQDYYDPYADPFGFDYANPVYTYDPYSVTLDEAIAQGRNQVNYPPGSVTMDEAVQQGRDTYAAASAADPAAYPAGAAAGAGAADWWNPADPQGSFMRLVAGKPANSETLKSLEAELAKVGITLVGNAAGTLFDSIKLPNGEVIDVGVAFSSGNPGQMQWGWQTGGGQKPVLPAGFAVGDFLKPWTETFTPPPDAATRYPTLPDLSLPEVPDLPEFAPPTADSMFADPGYQFRRKQGEDALLNNRAAQGLLRTGGTVKDFLDYNQNFASQEYGNIFDRALTTHQLNRDNILDQYGLGVTRASAMYEPSLARYQYEFPAAQVDANTAWSRAWDEYQDRKGTFYEGQDRPFSKLKWQTELGLSAI